MDNKNTIDFIKSTINNITINDLISDSNISYKFEDYTIILYHQNPLLISKTSFNRYNICDEKFYININIININIESIEIDQNTFQYITNLLQNKIDTIKQQEIIKLNQLKLKYTRKQKLNKL